MRGQNGLKFYKNNKVSRDMPLITKILISIAVTFAIVILAISFTAVILLNEFVSLEGNHM